MARIVIIMGLLVQWAVVVRSNGERAAHGLVPSLSSSAWNRKAYPFVRGGSYNNDTREKTRSAHQVSVCSVQGGRAYMEDEYYVNPHGNFAAVFDGHGGKAVSRYLRQNLYANLQAALPTPSRNSTEIEEQSSSLTPPMMAPSVQEYQDALQSALEKVDREVQRISHWSFQGSTAVAVWIHEDPTSLRRTIVTANVGDSRAVLSRQGVAVDLTRDHKPNDVHEQARIEAAGGKVIWCGVVDARGRPLPDAGIYRVNGNLALSRAIGDRSERPAVTSSPDMSTLDMEANDDFIVVGSDGLWDVMTSQDVVSFVLGHLQHEHDPSDSDTLDRKILQQKMADMVVSEALKRGTTDNVTVVIMWLNRWSL